MFTCTLAVLFAFATGVSVGRRFPSLLAKAQAALHAAQAEATAVETSIRAKLNGITTHPDGPAANVTTK